jgi:hypothetical protein
MERIRGLLSGSLSRAGIMRSVSASMIVEEVNRILPSYLPNNRKTDISAVSYKEGTIQMIAKNASARYSIKSQQKEILEELNKRFSGSKIKLISIKF